MIATLFDRPPVPAQRCTFRAPFTIITFTSRPFSSEPVEGLGSTCASLDRARVPISSAAIPGYSGASEKRQPLDISRTLVYP